MMRAHKQQVTIVRKSESSERNEWENLGQHEGGKTISLQLTFEEMKRKEEEKLIG